MAETRSGTGTLPGDEVLLRALERGVDEVFTSMVGTFESLTAQSVHGTPPALPRSGGGGGFDREAVVEFRGAIQGHVVLRCTAEGATELASGLLMLEDGGSSLSVDEINDALKECANMVTGHVKTKVLDPLGSCEMSVPQLRPAPSCADHAGAGALLYRLRQGMLSVEIWRDAAPVRVD